MRDSAWSYFMKAYELSQKTHNKTGLASICTMLGAYYMEIGDIKKAKTYTLEAFEIAKETGFTIQIISLTDLLKKIYTKEGNYKSALEVYELNIKTRDSLSNEKVRKEATEKEYNYNLEKKENENKLLAQQNQIQNLQMQQSRYFSLGLGVLLLLVILVAILFARQNRFRSEQKNVQMEQKLLRTQMNPHFIFNSLNTIQQFIITNDNDKAQLYLSKFSRLMRRLLESNTKESITLKEEVEILEKYLEIESLRFNNVFSYQIKVAENINPTQINMPHFLIQPFVENAIWHGLLPKEGDKELKIVFEKQGENTLSCTIDDNGVGRQNKLQKAPFEEKKSLAISFIKQRLALMNKVKKTNYALTLTDKKDAAGNDAGLSVRITMPVLNENL
jgi:LytS/YehU family sensor histidine kinase